MLLEPFLDRQYFLPDDNVGGITRNAFRADRKLNRGKKKKKKVRRHKRLARTTSAARLRTRPRRMVMFDG